MEGEEQSIVGVQVRILERARARRGGSGGGGGSLWDTLWRSMGLLLFKKTAVLGLLDERKRPHRGFAGEAFEGAFKPTS